MNINGKWVDLSKMTLAEASRITGVSVSTIKRMLKEAKARKLLEKANRELRDFGAGWNPHSGPSKGLRT